MPRRLRFLALPLALAAAACATPPLADGAGDGPTFVVVRHAEKATDDPRDPALTDAGRQRAEALAARLAATPVTAVYATGFRRTQQTAAPIAARHGLAVHGYDAALDATEFAASLRRAHPAGTAVVVGHSNTVPGIVSALCECAVAPIDETVYGDRYTVRIDAAGRATLLHARD